MCFLVFAYDRNTKRWSRVSKPVKIITILDWYFYDFNNPCGNTLIGECINHTLEVFKEHIISKGYDSKDILYIDNSFGLLTRHDISVASEQDMRKKDYKRFRNILGWISLNLKNDTLEITMRNVDGNEYLRRGIKGSVKEVCNAYFKYNDNTMKWDCIKSIITHSSDRNDPDKIVQSDFETKPLSNLDILNINKNILYEKY